MELELCILLSGFILLLVYWGEVYLYYNCIVLLYSLFDWNKGMNPDLKLSQCLMVSVNVSFNVSIWIWIFFCIYFICWYLFYTSVWGIYHRQMIYLNTYNFIVKWCKFYPSFYHRQMMHVLSHFTVIKHITKCTLCPNFYWFITSHNKLFVMLDMSKQKVVSCWV